MSAGKASVQDHSERRVGVTMRTMDAMRSDMKESHARSSLIRWEALQQLLRHCLCRKKRRASRSRGKIRKHRYEGMLAVAADKNEKVLNVRKENYAIISEGSDRLAAELRKVTADHGDDVKEKQETPHY